MTKPLSLLTLNTWKCDGDFARRVALMRDGIRRLRPDVILLQEAFEADGREAGIARRVAVDLGLELAYVPAREHWRPFEGETVRSWSGMATLATPPIMRSTSVSLPSHPDDGERVAQLSIIESAGRRLLIGNVHLTYLRDAASVRIAQLRRVLSHPWMRGEYDAVFVCGDFNASPDSPSMQWLWQEAPRRFIDCFAVLNPGRERHSTLRGKAKGGAGSRLGPNYDYILLGEPAPALELLDCDYVFDRLDPVSGLYASDHFGVRVSFRFRAS